MSQHSPPHLTGRRPFIGKCSSTPSHPHISISTRAATIDPRDQTSEIWRTLSLRAPKYKPLRVLRTFEHWCRERVVGEGHVRVVPTDDITAAFATKLSGVSAVVVSNRVVLKIGSGVTAPGELPPNRPSGGGARGVW